jgi:hypothetical protein
VIAPVAWSREKTETAPLTSDATYTFLPSGLIATVRAPSRPVPSAHAPPVPVSLTQPFVPPSCVSAPVVASREKTATASLKKEVT